MNMTQYQNVAFDRSKSVFVDTTSTKSNEATFDSKPVMAKIGGTTVPMVRSSITLRSAVQATVSCGNDCPPEIVESVSISFNVEQGADRLVALRAETIRLLDIAIAEYNMTKGLVPPVFATFASA